jgi:hypothetical protein
MIPIFLQKAGTTSKADRVLVHVKAFDVVKVDCHDETKMITDESLKALQGQQLLAGLAYYGKLDVHKKTTLPVMRGLLLPLIRPDMITAAAAAAATAAAEIDRLTRENQALRASAASSTAKQADDDSGDDDDDDDDEGCDPPTSIEVNTLEKDYESSGMQWVHEVSMLVYVQPPNNAAKVWIDVSFTATVEVVKAKIHARTGIQPAQQAVFFGTRQLQEGSTLDIYNVSPSDTLEVRVVSGEGEDEGCDPPTSVEVNTIEHGYESSGMQSPDEQVLPTSNPTNQTNPTNANQ